MLYHITVNLGYRFENYDGLDFLIWKEDKTLYLAFIMDVNFVNKVSIINKLYSTIAARRLCQTVVGGQEGQWHNGAERGLHCEEVTICLLAVHGQMSGFYYVVKYGEKTVTIKTTKVSHLFIQLFMIQQQ